MHASFCHRFAGGAVSRINLMAKFPGNKKEAVDGDADDAGRLTQRDLSRYFYVAPGRRGAARGLCSNLRHNWVSSTFNLFQTAKPHSRFSVSDRNFAVKSNRIEAKRIVRRRNLRGPDTFQMMNRGGSARRRTSRNFTRLSEIIVLASSKSSRIMGDGS